MNNSLKATMFNFKALMKYFALSLIVVLTIILIAEYEDFVLFERFQNDISKLSDELHGNIQRQDIYSYRSEIVGIVNSNLNMNITSFNEINKLTDEQWEILIKESVSKESGFFSTLLLSMTFADQEIKDRYQYFLKKGAPWLDQNTLNPIIKGTEDYIIQKESNSNITLIRFMKYLVND